MWYVKYRMRLCDVPPPAHLAKLRILASTAICECGTDVDDLNCIFFSCLYYDYYSLFENLLTYPIPSSTSICNVLYLNDIHSYIIILSIFIYEQY